MSHNNERHLAGPRKAFSTLVLFGKRRSYKSIRKMACIEQVKTVLHENHAHRRYSRQLVKIIGGTVYLSVLFIIITVLCITDFNSISE